MTHGRASRDGNGGRQQAWVSTRRPSDGRESEPRQRVPESLVSPGAPGPVCYSRLRFSQSGSSVRACGCTGSSQRALGLDMPRVSAIHAKIIVKATLALLGSQLTVSNDVNLHGDNVIRA